MLKFGTLKKKLLNVKIGRRNAKEVFIEETLQPEEQPTSDLVKEEEVLKYQPLTYKDILYRVSCNFENNFEENIEVLQFMKNVFSITKIEDEKISEEVKEELRNYKYESIIEHSLLMIEVMKYDLDKSKPGRYSKLEFLHPQTSKVINSHAKYKHLNKSEFAFARWTTLNEISSIYSLHPSIINEVIDAVTVVDQETNVFRLKTEIEGVAEDFWKYSETFMKSCLGFIENLPNEEKLETKQNENILMSFFEAVNKLQKCNPIGDFLVSKNFGELIKESLALGVNKCLLEAGEAGKFQDEKKVSKITNIVVMALEKYQNFVEQHSNSFKA